MNADTKTATAPAPNPTPAAPVPRGVHEIQTGWLKEHLGEPVKVGLLTGKMLKGKLTAFDQFSLQVQLEDDSILIYKHGVAFLAPDLGD